MELARLLRELHDSSALLNNALLQGLLPAGAPGRDAERMAIRVRAAVLSAVTSLADGAGNVHFERQRSIVTRCDLGGEKHAAVAREMGISLREFYRERRRALARLLDALQMSLPAAPARVRPLPSRFELDLDDVANLRLIGNFGSAFDRLERLSAQAPATEDQVRALCYAVEIAADIGDEERARRWYADALARATAVDANQRLELHLPMAGAYVAWQTGDLATSGARIRRASEAAATLSGEAERHDVRAASNALFALSEMGVLLGDPAASLDALRKVRRLLEGMRYKPSDLLGQLFMEFSAAYGLIAGEQRRAIEYALESLSAFDAAGAAGNIADAAGMLATHLCAAGDAIGAQRFSDAAIEFARRSASPAAVADKLLIGSRTAIVCGRPRDALRLADEAAASAPGGLFFVRVPLAQADARLHVGDPAGAIVLANRARQHAARNGMPRYTGAATRLCAEAAFALGDARVAAELAIAALETLLQHGHPPSIAQAYETCRRLGVAHHGLAAAGEIRASLTLPAETIVELLP